MVLPGKKKPKFFPTSNYFCVSYCHEIFIPCPLLYSCNMNFVIMHFGNLVLSLNIVYFSGASENPKVTKQVSKLSSKVEGIA
ncbi:hypothetical protein AQUCO_01000078v1 [Aquilegia coerulea]|uniref:Uncharacterized protein n=1 Tax=Aquilegia coerulea TaxID=218851 RepID=A0A2G5E8S9_AQUCA|nr:hypothetical protein AQUCO_01000078v1 [Aquilegia coerulea]